MYGIILKILGITKIYISNSKYYYIHLKYYYSIEISIKSMCIITVFTSYYPSVPPTLSEVIHLST
jgi:hypothetical protein